MKKTGSEILVECLRREGVEVVFGIPGGVLLPTFDKLYDSKLKVVLTRHEQGACHMADGYSRSTGKVGVCIATSGPGATNLVTGLATASMDSIPMVAITGQVKTSLIGNDAFQEADTTGITRPVTKHNYLVKDINELSDTIREAFHIASTGRPGPVLIDIPVDVQTSSAEFRWKEKVDIKSYKPAIKGHPGQVKKLADAINSSKKPVLYVGGGSVISGASREIKALAEKADIPVTTTLMAMGEFPPGHRLDLGMLGMHGTYWANMSIQNADLIISAGARFDDRCTGNLQAFAPKARTVAHIDIDPTSISKNVRAQIPVVGDLKGILQELNGKVKKKNRPEWMKRIGAWRKKKPVKYINDDKPRPHYIIGKISELTKGRAILTTEVGQNQMWSAQFYKPAATRHFVTSGGLGTMGYGFPAAIGAKIANPGKTVVCVAGDGSFQMNIQELATAVINKVGVVVCILDNSCLGMVRQWQQMFYGKRYSSSHLHTHVCGKNRKPVPDFVKVAQAYGAEGMRVTKKSEVVPALREALSAGNKPVVIDFIIPYEENVFPMVPAGAALDEVITHYV